MKNKVIGVLVFILIAGGVRMAIKGAQYQYAEHKVNKGDTYQAPVDFKADLIKGCVDAPEGTEANRQFCVCAADYLQETLGDAKLQALALEYVKTNVTPPEMTKAAEFCIDYYVPVTNM